MATHIYRNRDHKNTPKTEGGMAGTILNSYTGGAHVHISAVTGPNIMYKGLLERHSLCLSNGALHMPIHTEEGKIFRFLHSQNMHNCTIATASKMTEWIYRLLYIISLKGTYMYQLK